MKASTHRPLLLGHRGARAVKSIPENSVASFDRALADGCDGFEFDVRLAGDGTAVVCHDPKCNGIEIEQATRERLPTLAGLEEVLARYEGRAFLDIELKVGGLEKIVLAALREHPPRRGFVVSSFLPEVLHAVHSSDSEVPLGLICETRAELGRWRGLPVEYVIPEWKLINSTLMKEWKEAGKKVFVWTVNDYDTMRALARLGVDGIISDNTMLLARTLG